MTSPSGAWSTVKTRTARRAKWLIVPPILVAFGLTELLVRQIYERHDMIDPELGYINRPGSSVRMGVEGSGTSHWTEYGLRGTAAPSVTQPAILALGDSFTAAEMIADDDVYTARVERQLSKAGIERQVLNAGGNSKSIADYIDRPERYTQHYNIKWTVVQLRERDLQDDAWDKTKPLKAYFKKSTTNGPLEIAVAPRPYYLHGFNEVLFAWRQRVMLIGFGVTRLALLAQAAREEPPLFFANKSSSQSPRHEYPIEEELDALVAAWQGKLTIAYIPDFDPSAPYAPEAVEQRLLTYCKAKGISCVNPRSLYPHLAESGISPFGFPNSNYNTGHLNEDGHQALSQVLGAELIGLAKHGVL